MSLVAVSLLVCQATSFLQIINSTTQCPKSEAMTSLSLFLIGKTGHGKSSTGNSLLGHEAFSVSDSAASVTSVVQVGTATRDGRQVLVVDGPGIGDTRLDSAEALRKTFDDMNQGIQASPSGIGVFLLVLNYGHRFTEEEKSTIDTLKSTLGDNFVRDHCIIVFTHGELFDLNNQSSMTLADWISQQTGGLKSLTDEAENRCVLVYNRDPQKMGSSIAELVSLADNLVSRKGPYTVQNYQSMEGRRQQLLVRADAPRLRSTFDSEVSSRSQVLTQIQSDGQSHDNKLARLASLANDIRSLKQRITDEEKGTDVLSAQRQSCDSLLSSVQAQEKAVNDAKAAEAERQRLEAVRAEQQRLEEEAARARSGGKKKKFLGLFR